MKRSKRIMGGLLALIAASILPFSASAAPKAEQSVTVRTAEGVTLSRSYLIDGTTYVPFREYCDAYGIGGAVGWEDESKTATYRADGLSIDVTIGQPYLRANGRIFFRNAANLLIDGRTYVPVRAISAAFDKEVLWQDDGIERSVTLSGKSRAIEGATEIYDEESLLWLARVICAESIGEPLLGKIAVGNVVMNRIASELFPDSVYDVIFDCRGGSKQFYRPGDPYIMREPTEECYLAAKICLEGYSVSKETLFYLNPRIATNFWIVKNRPYLFSIGLHDFYA